MHPLRGVDEAGGRQAGERAALEGAAAALNELLAPPQCVHMVEAIVLKYVALTPDELIEWQARTQETRFSKQQAKM